VISQKAEPDQIRANTSVNWVRGIDPVLNNAGAQIASASVDDGWSAAYELRNASSFIQLPTDGSDNTYTVNISAATTQNYAAGEYSWELYITNGSDRHFIDSGTLTVIGYTAGAQDMRSQVKRTLDMIDAMIEGRASKDVQEYSIDTGAGSRSLKHLSVDELFKFRRYYASLYQAEQKAVGKGRSTTIKPRFDNRTGGY